MILSLSMNLHSLPKRNNRVRPKRRLGRGYGSASGGHTVGRGQKGQKSRSGHKSMALFEGGNVPFFRRMPKYRGFKNVNKVVYQPINVEILDENFNEDEIVSIDTLREKGLIRKGTKAVKILGLGELNKKLVIQDLKLSESAREKVLSAKGQIK